MEQKNILFSSATELAEKISQGELSSFEVVSAYIRQIEEQNKTYNAIVLTDKENALQQAKSADLAVQQGKPLGKLHGVPITIKDNYHTQGLTSTAGIEPLRNHVPDNNAQIVKLLKAEGAIIIGKTNLSTLAMDMQADNPVFGRTNNAWDTSRTSGGSSGGCAAALATGMTPLSFGNDLAGSIRIPSAYCGVYGLKPTFGVVSLKGIQADPNEPVNGLRALAVGGPLARNIDDLELAMDIVAHCTDTDRKVLPVNRCTDTFEVRNLKIAWADELGGVPVDDEMKKAIQTFIGKLEAAGATVEKISPPIDFYQAWKTWGSIVGMQGGYNTPNFIKWMGLPFTKGVLKHVPMHQNIVKPTSVKKYMQALNSQDEMINQMDKFLDDYHAFICPVSAVTAFKHHPVTKKYGHFNIYNQPLSVNGQKIHYYMATQGYTTPFTLTENPVLTIPVSLSQEALPIGIQIIGKRYSDFRLLRIGSAINKYIVKFKYPLE